MAAIAAIQLLIKMWVIVLGDEVVKSAILLRRIKLQAGIVLELRVIEVCLFPCMWASFVLPIMRKSVCVPIRGKEDHLVFSPAFLLFKPKATVYMQY